LKRTGKYLIISFVIAAVGLAAGGAFWLIGTTAGARWLLAAVSRKPDLIIEARSVEGRLAGTLRLDQLRIQWPEGNIRVDQIDLTVRPLPLIVGEISISRLAVKNITVTDNAPDKPPVLQWPATPRAFSWLAAAIDKIDIAGLTYHRREEAPLRVRSITASAEWRRGFLSVANLRVVSDPVTVSGNILAGFVNPLLETNLEARLSGPVAEMEHFRLRGKFTPGKKHERMAGPLYLSGSRGDKGAKPLWVLTLDAAMTGEGFPFRNVRLSRPEKKGLITADGIMTFEGAEPHLQLTARAKDVDWIADLTAPANLSGTFTFKGSAKHYRGGFAFVNRGESWQSVGLAGDYAGTAQSAAVNITRGTVLKGSLAGRLDLDWRQGVTVSGALRARNLDPAVIDKKWTGEIHFDLEGRISSSETNNPGSEMTLLLKQSRLHGQTLTGELRAAAVGEDVQISRLELSGKGFQLHAAGAVRDKLDYTARISDLSLLLPKAAGSLTADGWVRRRGGKISGVISAETAGLALDRLQVASARIRASLEDSKTAPLNVQGTLNKLRYGSFHADTFTLQAGGALPKHAATATLRSGRYEANLAVNGSYRDRRWQGEITRLDGKDKVGPWRLAQPARLAVASDSLTIDPLILTGADSETLRASCRLTKAASAGSIALVWNDLRLDRVGSWLSQAAVSGVTRGNIQLNLLSPSRIELRGKASLRGAFQLEGKSVGIREGELTLDAGPEGSKAGINISLADGGMLTGDFASGAPAGLSLPAEGRFSLRLQDFEPILLTTLLAKPLRIEGKIGGQLSGRLLPDERFTMTGSVAAANATVHWQEKKSRISIGLKKASLDWVWRDNELGGSLALTLAEYGKLQGRFHLPLAARFPLKMDETGKFQASLTGKVSEKGALTSLFPGLIQESRGNLDIDLQLTGSWKDPLLAGGARLSQAGGYLPTAGITIKEAGADIRFTGDSIHVDAFRIASGPGHLAGAVLLRIKDGRVAGFEGRLDGDRFQTIYFPELQMQISPKLVFSGTPEKVVIQGDVLLPEVKILGAQARSQVQTSPDVVREGKSKPAANKLPFDLDANVKLILGDSVFFDAAGINARLGGKMDLQFKELDKIKSSGEIRVIKGSFQAYGVNLDITRGRLYYAKAPIENPLLDILALKKVEDVRVGAAVGGTLENPVIKLYSEPPMPDTDILAYIVLGHPMSGDTDQAAVLAAAAGALLTSRQAEELQGQIKGRLGLGSFNISAGVMEQSGKMGYKPIKLTPGGTGAAKTQEGETMVMVGRYLTPGLYISYGRSIFTGTNLFTLRYDLSKNWQVESYTGDSSGVDIYYKIEFN